VKGAIAESPIQFVSVFSTGKAGSLIVVIPVEVIEKLQVKKGSKFLVKIDARGRIIYEPVPPPLNVHEALLAH
jgi:antitoxin component of MazEF toxin-antitoxin module